MVSGLGSANGLRTVVFSGRLRKRLRRRLYPFSSGVKPVLRTLKAPFLLLIKVKKLEET